MNIIDKIESSHYVANEAQLETLAHDAYKADTLVQRTGNVYLRVVVAACQAKLGPVRRGKAPSPDSQLSVLDEVHEPFYLAILRGVTTTDVAPDPKHEAAERNRRTLERSRRTTFARSAKSTLASFARNGGDIRALKVETVTKASLRAATAPAQASETEPITRAQDAIVRAITRQAREDPDGARAELERVMDELQKVLDSLASEPDHASTTTIVASRQHARTRVGTPQLHRSAA